MIGQTFKNNWLHFERPLCLRKTQEIWLILEFIRPWPLQDDLFVFLGQSPAAICIYGEIIPINVFYKSILIKNECAISPNNFIFYAWICRFELVLKLLVSNLFFDKIIHKRHKFVRALLNIAIGTESYIKFHCFLIGTAIYIFRGKWLSWQIAVNPFVMLALNTIIVYWT